MCIGTEYAVSIETPQYSVGIVPEIDIGVKWLSDSCHCGCQALSVSSSGDRRSNREQDQPFVCADSGSAANGTMCCPFCFWGGEGMTTALRADLSSRGLAANSVESPLAYRLLIENAFLRLCALPARRPHSRHERQETQAVTAVWSSTYVGTEGGWLAVEQLGSLLVQTAVLDTQLLTIQRK